MKPDNFDLRILAELQKDARQTNQALAEKVGLSATPCLRRVRRLEENGLVTGYKAAINRKSVDLGLTVFVTVKVERHQDAEAAEFVGTVTAWPEVLSCHLVSGDMDFLMEVVAPDVEGYEKFVLQRLLKIPGIKDVRSNFVMRTHKSDGSLPIEVS
ncbi:MAG TPA: Lrp/AsnC family transcriptional regulator [Rhizobiales bacterium]|nr:Lrp/AsnC family transcriptional regulator [Hyphomicrobiales bacterium]